MNAPAPPPTLTCWGAARTVTGSMHLVEVGERAILLDCGLFQGRRHDAYRRNSQFPFHPSKISAVILSHAHIDHCGNLPNLIRQGFRGPICSTQTTADLAAIMLADSARIQEEESAWNARRTNLDAWIEPLYTTNDAVHCSQSIMPVSYEAPFEILPGCNVTLLDAGHIPGSAMVHLNIDGEFTLTYTGDLGRREFDVFPPAAPIPSADIVLAECTYGGRRHPLLSDAVAELGGAVTRVASRGGKVLVPAFGLGRAQLLAHYLVDLMDSGRAPRLPVFVDSPLAAAVANVYRQHVEAFRIDLPGDMSRVHYVQSFNESLALCDSPAPCVIIAAGGMCEGGRIIQHLVRNVSDPAACIVLVSFQAPRTLGRQLLERPPIVHILGRDYPLRAEVIHLEGFSSHADHDDLMAQLTPLAGTGSRVRLIHGEPAAAEALEADLRAHGITDVGHPETGDREELRRVTT